MRCERAQRVISDALDERLRDAEREVVDLHLTSCADCARYEQRLAGLRRQLRVAVVEPPPDIAATLRERLEGEPRRTSRRRDRIDAFPVARVAAVFVVAFSIAAAAVGLRGPRPAAAVDVAALVLTGQHRVDRLHADLTVVEHGWHPEVPVRTYRGSLSYRAPETFHLELEDRTDYPDGRWQANDLTVVVDEDRSWSRANVPCPASALPGCAAGIPRTEVVTGRQPFDPSGASPLDMVVAVDSFSVGDAPSDRDVVDVDGRHAIVVDVTVSQIRPILDGLTGSGTWRSFHATDRAEVALDAVHGVPLAVRIAASDDPQRQRWAAVHGYRDPAGATLLSWQLRNVTINGSVTVPPAPIPTSADTTTVDRGFIDRAVTDGPLPAWVPDDMAIHRSGEAAGVLVVSWTDGRAWLRIRSNDEWDGPRLFGRAGGQVVRRVTLRPDSVGYVAEGGNQVFVHAEGVDISVEGSLPPDDLRRAAASLPVDGVTVPAGWREASVASIDDARRRLPGMLDAEGLEGFVGPAVGIPGNVVSLSYAGNGSRAFVITQTYGDHLPPPLDDVVMGVALRGTVGRYTPATGDLEWTESGHLVSVRSGTIGLAELLAIAESLRALP